jgi:prepilin-type processing-associated H-X9-DG protein
MSNWQNSVRFCAVATHPSSVPKEFFFSSYGYNAFGLATNKDVNSLGLGGHHGMGNLRSDGKIISAPPIGESEVASPSDMMAIGDGFIGNNLFIQDGSAYFWRATTGDFFGSTVRANARHQGRPNVVFCDGHVEAPKLQFLFEETDDAALAPWNYDHQPIEKSYDTYQIAAANAGWRFEFRIRGLAFSPGVAELLSLGRISHASP